MMERILPLGVLGAGLWGLLLGHLGLGFVVTLLGAAWLWERSEDR